MSGIDIFLSYSREDRAAVRHIAESFEAEGLDAHFAAEKDLTLKEAALQLGHVEEATFDRVVDPAKMVRPYVANKADHGVRAADTVEIAQMEQTR